MSEIALIEVPYHLGREGVGLGAGPRPLRDAIGGDAVVVGRGDGFPNEVQASVAVVRQLAGAVRSAVRDGRFPVVLAGNCMTSLGTVAGLDSRGLGVVWFDAHADFHTPDTSETGFLDGMPLAMLTGSGWAAVRATVPGLRPVAEERVVLVGARSIDDGEDTRLARSRVAVVRRPPVDDALERLPADVRDIYLHVDLDVLDPSEGKASWWAEPDGFTLDEVEGALAAVGNRFRIRALALTAYDPSCDPDGRIPAAAASIVARVRALVADQESVPS